MKEEFLHYLWQYRLFQMSLYTTNQQLVEVVNTGVLNSNAGPDFLQAKIKIGSTVWVGNIEVHVNASDWNRHGHQFDKAYNTTILHVVYKCDTHILLENGEAPPCLELKGLFSEVLYKKYRGFLKAKKWIACSGQLKNIPAITFDTMYARMSVERLEAKTKSVEERCLKNKNDWEESFYQELAGGFGLQINKEPFQRLAESLPLKIVLKHSHNILQVEALLFGQAGMLQLEFSDEYPRSLKKEYKYQAAKYKLESLQGHLWKYLRLRPANFPTIRIAQFASLLSLHQKLFSKIMDAKTIEELYALFCLNASEYWDTHYVFDKISPKRAKQFTSSRINLLIVNTVVPFLFLYGKQQNKESLTERALLFLDKLPPESNRTIQKFAGEGVPVRSALDTQALLQLKAAYCDKKRCLHCPIGNRLLR